MSEGMTVLICGSRDWDNPLRIRVELTRLARVAPGLTVIHGNARGADKQADSIARGMGLDVQAFPADWRGKGKRAGILRNLAMLDQEPDLVLAFQRNGSTGTQHTIDEARRRGIAVEVFRPSPNKESGPA